MSTPSKAKGSRFWRKLRIYFRRFRIAVWLLALALLGALIYLNLVGLPDFLKRPLVARIREAGLDVDFAALRLHWSRGFIAEQVSFGASQATNDPAVPRFTAEELEFNFHLRALLQGRLQLDSVTLRRGQLHWTLRDANPDSNAPPTTLTISDIESSFRLLPGDCWALDDFRAQFGGAHFFVSGSLTNAATLFTGKPTPPGPPGPPAPPGPSRQISAAQLQRISDLVNQIKFPTPPELRLEVTGDVTDLRTFDALLSVKAAAAQTPWGAGADLLLLTRLSPPESNELSRLEINLQAGAADTRWASTTNLELKLRLETSAAQPELVQGNLTLRAAGAASRWASVTGAQLKASWTQSVTNPIPRQAQIESHADAVNSWLTRGLDMDFAATLEALPDPPPPDDALGYWNALLPYQTRWSGSIGRLRSLLIQADQLSATGHWQSPALSISNLQAQLYQGSLAGAAHLDVQSRELHAQCASDFDPFRILPLLPAGAQNWLKKFTWANPPKLACDIAATLPAWTDPPADWQQALEPTLRLAGQVAVTNGTYQGVYADWATTHFYFSNLVWYLPDLTVGRPEGGLQIVHQADDATHEYYFRIHSTIDPRAVLPALDPEVRSGFDLCEFGQPPEIDGELWGHWHDVSRLGFRGQIALTNFAVRGQAMAAAVTRLDYTNLVVTLHEPRVWNGLQNLAADAVTADFNAHRVYFTNAFSTFAPSNIVHAIGPVVTRVMSPYHFGAPPIAHVSGYAPMGDPDDSDLIFEGEGQSFEALNFKAQNYRAKVHWQGDRLTITNVTGDFYGGQASGWARFVFDEHGEAQYAFTVNVTNVQLSALVADVTQKTNHLEGLLTGQLVITNADTESIKTWTGAGQAVLRDGLLWELPIFGVLSGPLDSLMPGVGNSKFTEAHGTFTLGNGLISSSDLQMRSSMMRLKYRGTVDFDGNLDSRIIAELLRDTPVVGSVVSAILSPVAHLFAYRVTGTMEDPKSEPIYIPDPLRYLFSPFQTIGNLFSSEPAKPAPEKFTPEPETK